MHEEENAPIENHEQVDLEEFYLNKIEQNSKNPDEALNAIRENIANKRGNGQVEYQDTKQFLKGTQTFSRRDEDVGFWKNDLTAILERNVTYGRYLKDYCSNFNKKSKSQRRLRRCFFWITMGLLSLIVVGSIVGVGSIFIRGSIGAGEIASVISAIVGMITAFLVLPKIIGDNLFPKQEDDKSADLFEVVVNKDFELRRFYQQDKIREYEDNIFGDEKDKYNKD